MNNILNKHQKSTDDNSGTAISNTPQPKNEQDESIIEIINSLSEEQKIGQLVIASVPSTSFNEATKALISDYYIGGVILYAKNITSVEQTQTLISNLNAANIQSIPLFVSIDEEGGTVSRIPSSMTKTPTAKYIGDKNDPDFAFSQGALVGDNLAKLGVNLNFAPVADINSNPKNPVIGNRAFSSNPQIAATMTHSFYKGMKSKGILAATKHFPGHGDTNVDSHFSLPIVYNSEKIIKSRELVPFKMLIADDIEMVMTSHIIVKDIDSELPTTLSTIVKQKLLFDYLNFKGVVISDDINMKAISNYYSLADASVLAINSGCDIVLISGSQEEIELVINSLRTAVKNKTISQARLDEALYKILLTKKKIKS